MVRGIGSLSWEIAAFEMDVRLAMAIIEIHFMSTDELPHFLCPHLNADAEEYVVWFTGRGKELNWVCRSCAALYPVEPTQWVPASSGALSLHHDLSWAGICGKPQVAERESQMRFEKANIVLVGHTGVRFVDAQPSHGRAGYWYALSGAAEIILFEASTSSILWSSRIEGIGFDITEETGLCVAAQNDFAVIYQASGSLAAVIDLNSRKVIVRLSRGDYRPENSFFPIAFFLHQGRTLLVAGSDWNRLDIIDPATRTRLTQREAITSEEGTRPPHYLDYFHGSLSVSPDNEHIVDGGWHWHPVGSLRCWSLRSWLENPWESEDGPTVKTLDWKEYFWDGPVCWIDDSILARWGWGQDEDWLIAAVVIVDARKGEAIRWFPGPLVRLPKAWPPRHLGNSLFFDTYLFAVDDHAGTTVWDIVSGERLLADREVKPWRYHPDSKEFLTVNPDGFCISRLV
jgi:hypothetical protein